ncbi:glycerophosphodiester phosphodiesterase family protein [Oceanibium sediminis]|uniref:glycerophosphodiester phosphodiesterase family protein n=1 Tax=Oceanibium sediminis TaxID=2026339 RepID=UPI000DD4C41D|nr:glycerophosphodiester phosphodiesterase family protein [Oceanibium sediminis]
MPDPALPPELLRLPLAHRALHDRAAGRVENSLSAIEAAVAAGYGIELDLQLSADGVAMVFHDDDLKRLTGRPEQVRDLRAAALAGVPLLDGAGDRISTLATALSVVGGKVPLLLELKDQDGAMGKRVGALEAAVVEDLQRYAGPVAVMSFNPHSVATLHQLAPHLACGIVTEDFEKPHYDALPAARRQALSALAEYDPAGACFVSCGKADLDRAPIHALKARGVPVLTWTIRSEEEESAARKIADNITFEGYPAKLAH